jgi:hypothetical protein
VLQGKQSKQAGIDHQGTADRSFHSGIDGPGPPKIPQERNGIEKSGKKYEITEDPVEQG